MNLKIKWIVATVLVLMTLIFAAGCSAEKTPYEINNGSGFTVSVKFDANGGLFATNTEVFMDSYNISGLPVNSEGQVELPLLPTDDPLRDIDAYTPEKSGYFLAGWYTNRVETAEGVSYEGKWDFETGRVSVDPNKTYDANEPVLTLYAAWVPLYEYEIYDLETKEALGKYSYNPIQGKELELPQWNQESGAMDMFNFPSRSGYTFKTCYLDEAGTIAAEGLTIPHHAQLDEQTATVKDNVMKLYVDWTEGEWYHIYTAQQFMQNAQVGGCYEIHADLDFEGLGWPQGLMYGNFTGMILGNGHTFKNIVAEQNDNSKLNGGLFGVLTEQARIGNVTFENCRFVIRKGASVPGTNYGFFAGNVNGAVVDNVQAVNCVLQIMPNVYFLTNEYYIGMVCGAGEPPIGSEGISCEFDENWRRTDEDTVVPVIAEDTQSETTDETVG